MKLALIITVSCMVGMFLGGGIANTIRARNEAQNLRDNRAAVETAMIACFPDYDLSLSATRTFFAQCLNSYIDRGN